MFQPLGKSDFTMLVSHLFPLIPVLGVLEALEAVVVGFNQKL